MRTFTVPGSDETFTIRRTTRPRGGAVDELDVHDSAGDTVLAVIVYKDGCVEPVYQSTSDVYWGRGDRWWADLVEAAAKAVPS